MLTGHVPDYANRSASLSQFNKTTNKIAIVIIIHNSPEDKGSLPTDEQHIKKRKSPEHKAAGFPGRLRPRKPLPPRTLYPNPPLTLSLPIALPVTK
ncbi:hypothetical protein SDC9_158589 [bioreactor metagenome]|uniref:Uncharacterized protein n=1 Tax=bioreactor metagenome TaxID=1076179 RepID=A0A645FA96_9ZZZZ